MKYKSILITGGTGSFGKSFVSWLIRHHKSDLRRLVIFSRDELKQFEMQQDFPIKKYKFLRYFIGDVKDLSRLKLALKGIDTIIHAAALKQVPASEYNPFETIKTNILGAQNVIEATLDSDVSKVLALSTDKAAAPINLYGATKLCSDKLFTSANNIFGNSLKTKKLFSVIRYGNVVGSRGSVIPFFLKRNPNDYYPITSEKMTRFSIKMIEAIKMVDWVFNNAKGGEIFVPKIPSYNILELLKAINLKAKYKIVGIRPGEKLHEEMITESDGYNTVDLGKYYAILQNREVFKKFNNKHKLKFVKSGFSYNSRDNNNFLSQTELKKIIKEFKNEKKL
jgi:UDP-N-acetylglucosamine 4,6-dehydratase/5-epimerase